MSNRAVAGLELRMLGFYNSRFQSICAQVLRTNPLGHRLYGMAFCESSGLTPLKNLWVPGILNSPRLDWYASHLLNNDCIKDCDGPIFSRFRSEARGRHLTSEGPSRAIACHEAKVPTNGGLILPRVQFAREKPLPKIGCSTYDCAPWFLLLLFIAEKLAWCNLWFCF